MDIVISSGHGKHVAGASGYLVEVPEARKVVDRVAQILSDAGHVAMVFHDNTSTNKDQNLKTIVSYHNSKSRDLDVSVHFNSSNGKTQNPIGTECWYKTQAHLANEVAAAIAESSGLINRKGKQTDSFYFLNYTHMPAVLVEVAFVNSKADSDIYLAEFENICVALAGVLVGEEDLPVAPPEGPATEAKPNLSKGDEGEWVVYLQQQLNSDNRAGLATDGDFGSATDTALRNYQASRRLDVDGICGPQTWEALEADWPPYTPPGLPPPMSDTQIAEVVRIAENSEIARYDWSERGVAPAGYTKGVAVAFANTYRQMLGKYPPAQEMSEPVGEGDKDALDYYEDIFEDRDIPLNSPTEILLALWTMILGLGMRESSGKHCCGRDMSADNTSSDTCEAGAWQTSWNAHSFSGNFDILFEAYSAGGGANPQGLVEIFREGVTCSSSDWSNYGSGNGYKHQQMSKEQPAYAAEVCAVTLRNRYDHYGPIKSMAAQIVPAAYEMFCSVKEYIDTEEVSV